jgi:hypothetical protein
MFTFFRRVSPKFAWLGMASLLCAFAYTANAQSKEVSPLEQIEPATTTAPYALFQFATLTGTGNSVTGVLVPVVLSNGTIIYDNVTLTFDVSSTGALTVGSLAVAAAPTPVISSFAKGQYVGPSTINGGKNIINVSGPGVASGGVTEWSLAAASGASCYTYPATATWYVGPLADNPLAARVKAAGINTTSTTMYFGIASEACVYSGYWETGTLIGVSQTGNSLTIASFSYEGSKDYSTIQDQITYTLVP